MLERRPAHVRGMSIGGSKPKHLVSSVILDAFLLYLGERGILLRPVRAQVFVTDVRGFDKLLMSESSRVLWEQVWEAYVAIRKKGVVTADSQRNLSRARRYRADLRSAYLLFATSCTIRSASDLSVDLFDAITAKLKLDEYPAKRLDLIRFLYKAIRKSSPHNTPIQRYILPRTKGMYGRRFDWTRLVYSETTKRRFPAFFRGPYLPSPSIIGWAELFLSSLSRIESKNISNWLSSMNNFLVWLVVSKSSALTILDITRADINDGAPPVTSGCFRAFLINRGISPTSVTDTMSRMGSFFDQEIDAQNACIPSPFKLRFDAQKKMMRRGKTHRIALPRNLLEYIRDFNNQGDFAFSRSKSAHHRVVRHRDDNHLSDVWFPGIAILMDFLLRIPIRGFQVRFLDSGEGDEFHPNLDEADLPMMRSSLPSAIKGRREFVLTSIDGFSSSRILGLYINTNKTAVDRATGYEIPWCDTALKANILRLRAWQWDWNGIHSPILCVDKGHLPENPAVLASIKATFPLFRDPSEPDCNPINRDTLRRYWDDLCAAVEDDIKEKSCGTKSVRLTSDVVIDKGRGKIERRKVSRYDIHSLRVSGITALIEAGMPPDLVRRLAGHATMIMTLYYNKSSTGELNSRLKAAMDNLTVEVCDVRSDPGEDLVAIADFLTNTRKEEDQGGAELLRECSGHGDGSFEVMSHGICPSGECATGGEWGNLAVGFKPVPRPLACSLCRYRLTGPMFLPGLILNANRLVHELRLKGREIAALNLQLETLRAKNKPTHLIAAQIASLYRVTDSITSEWAAEIKYVQVAKDLLAAFLDRSSTDASSQGSVIVSGLDMSEVEVRLEERSGFALLQTLSDGVQEWMGFRPEQALIEHREVLNEILSANSLDPFLLWLEGDMRDAAANMFGKAIMLHVPDERIAALRDGGERLEDFPAVFDAVSLIHSTVERLTYEKVADGAESLKRIMADLPT